jgi:hypothetical protein
MTVVDDAAAGPQTASLAYTGGVTELDADTFFGNLSIGASSTATIILFGSSDINNSPVTISGANASDFTFTAGGGSSSVCLIYNYANNCFFDITFSPTAPGPRTATVTIGGLGNLILTGGEGRP